MIKIAVSKGRIETNFYKMLLDKNLSNDIICPNRSLKINVNNEYELLLVKAIDVIRLVSKGYANVGVVGSDIIEEVNSRDIIELLDLESGICNFSLATLPCISIDDIDLIATKYPNITRRLLNNLGIDPTIIKMEGSLELAPLINYADGIVDLVETGNTLKANGLIILKMLEQISTRVICNIDNVDNSEVKNLIKRLER